jgi:hypothetical protein
MEKISCLALALIASWPMKATGQSTTYSQEVQADTFVSSGEPNVNFGLRGAMEIAAPTAAQPRTQIALLRFDTSALQAAFDTDYGAGNWTVTSVTLTLFSSVANAGQQPNNASFNRIAAGNFEFGLLGNNNWSEEGIAWNTLPGILPGDNNSNTLTPLGTFFWAAAGQGSSTWILNPDLNLERKIRDGEQVTLLGQPAAGSTVGYLFNTRNLDPAYLNVTAQAVPEPSTAALIAGFLCAAVCSRCRGLVSLPEGFGAKSRLTVAATFKSRLRRLKPCGYREPPPISQRLHATAALLECHPRPRQRAIRSRPVR